jgi:transcriptional regulator GlxA family with amidase domain
VIVGVALFEGAEELDWAGPWEVLAAWSKQWPDDGVRVLTLAREAGTITCAKGLQVVPEETWATAPPLDVLVYPGGRGTRRELADEAVLEWIRGLAGGGTVVASVCTGSLVLAAAGLLDGKPATTHWQSLELLPTLGREIEVRPDDRFVDNGNVLTAAGVSAGIAAPGRAAALTRACPRRAPLHPIRPRAAGLKSARRSTPTSRRCSF